MIPVGTWVMRTAESVVFTDWPPGPDERNTSIFRSLSSICNVDVLGLRHDGDGGGRRVDASLRLRFRHALHTMRAALELEDRVRTVALHGVHAVAELSPT